MAHLVGSQGAGFHAQGFESQAGGELTSSQPAAEGQMEEGHGKEEHQLGAGENPAKEGDAGEGAEQQHQHEEDRPVDAMVQPPPMAFLGLWTAFPFPGMNGQQPGPAYPYAMQHPYSGYWPFPHGMHPGALGTAMGKNEKTGKRRRKKKPVMEVRPGRSSSRVAVPRPAPSAVNSHLSLSWKSH